MEPWQRILLEIIEHYFAYFGIKYSPHKDITLLLTRYFNFRLRYIGTNKRQIIVSKELTDKLREHPYYNACIDIFHKTAHGKDLNPNQSTLLWNADNHDILFNDWGIHHLHLSNHKRNPKDFFYARSDYLLLIKFTDDRAYFIDIEKHKEKNLWSKTKYIRIIESNWPNLLSKESNDNLNNISDEDIAILRKKGFMYSLNLDNKVFGILNSGYSVSGDNLRAGMMSDDVIYWIGQNKHLIGTNIAYFKCELNKQLYIDF